MGELLGKLCVAIVRCLLLYPLGLVRMWIIGKTKKSFRTIIMENEFLFISAQGGVLILDIIAAIGSLVLLFLLIGMIGMLLWSLVKRTGII
jgi:hypothetical protein